MVNILAVLVAGIISMGFGALWYAPFAFGKMWMKLARVRKMKAVWWHWALGTVANLVMAYILALYTGGDGWLVGMGTGFLLWLGFVATFSLGTVLWEKKPWGLWALNNAHNLLMLLIMGLIIGAW